MAGRTEWVLLSYRMPREPSTRRIAAWRRLRRLGALQLGDGLYALPASSSTREQLDWLAEEAVDAGGDATVWIARAATVRQDRDLASQMKMSAAEEYREVIKEADDVARAAPGTRERSLARLRRELRRIAQRDHFPPPEREHARAAVEELARLREVAR